MKKLLSLFLITCISCFAAYSQNHRTVVTPIESSRSVISTEEESAKPLWQQLQEEGGKKEKEAQERIAREKFIADSLEQVRETNEKLEKERLVREKFIADSTEQVRIAKLKADQNAKHEENAKKEREAQERIAREKFVADSLEQVRETNERLEKERLEKEKLEKERGAIYGEQQKFTTNVFPKDAVKENGAIKAGFSISATEQVYFSQGNLQYQASTGTWRFAENQYDLIGADNSNISSSYSGWIDLFGWGTSGWNSGAIAYQPYSTSTSNSNYSQGRNPNNSLTGSYANADWGVYNTKWQISNGGNAAGMWRTLTNGEWSYLINNATKGTAQVNGVNGMVLLPDNWTLPAGLTFTAGTSGFTNNQYTAEQWATMEAAGAVFLPAGGYRYGTKVGNVGSGGNYWSSSASNHVLYLYFYSSSAGMSSSYRSYGRSVRLVQEVK